MPRSTRTHFVVFGIVAFLSTGSTASAQEVRWRQDYNTARREATETGRPLLLDFGTEACVWCRKLDATTFRDPKVVKLLNERFIPVKIDANKYERLTSALGIESYPTLILAAADGKVIGRHPGYAEVAEMLTFLDKAPAPKPPAAQTESVVAAPVRTPTDADRQQLAKEQLDAELAALHAKIAAGLDR